MGALASFCCCVTVFVIVAVFSVWLSFYLTAKHKGRNRNNFWPIDSFRDEHNGSSDPTSIERWPTDGTGGLSLHVLNALEQSWHPYFQVAVSDWDDGSPDALTLTTSVAPHEIECEAVSGKLKVCSGNYGDTGWRGINLALNQNGVIVASTSKMNDFYLAGSSDAQQQYTMVRPRLVWSSCFVSCTCGRIVAAPRH